MTLVGECLEVLIGSRKRTLPISKISMIAFSKVGVFNGIFLFPMDSVQRAQGFATMYK